MGTSVGENVGEANGAKGPAGDVGAAVGSADGAEGPVEDVGEAVGTADGAIGPVEDVGAAVGTAEGADGPVEDVGFGVGGAVSVMTVVLEPTSAAMVVLEVVEMEIPPVVPRKALVVLEVALVVVAASVSGIAVPAVQPDKCDARASNTGQSQRSACQQDGAAGPWPGRADDGIDMSWAKAT